jgi:hypothetical protein
MKTTIKVLAFALALTTTATFADKAKVDAKLTLPASTPVLETPAPQQKKTVNEYNKYTPAQKAAIVELKVAK